MNEGSAAEEQDPLTYKIIGAAIEVRSRIGAGLLESLYEEAYCVELEHRHLQYERQKPLAVRYRGRKIGTFRIDLVVENEVIVELKSVKELAPIHSTQIISYMKITGLTRGLLINFNVKQLTKGGIKRFVNLE
ncbi:MAG: GxxExxY protein [Chloroflexi bacterium]|nr:GxxExxY protein [Chloroflexota bacterium]